MDSFGSRQLLFDMFNASDLQKNKTSLVAAYDGEPCAALARRLAGIDRAQAPVPLESTAAGAGEL